MSPVSELVVELDRTAGDALHRQIEASIRERIRSGSLSAGITLPPTRALAAELGVSRGVVVEAYAQLVAEGYLTSRSGGYTQVASGPTAASHATGPRQHRVAPARVSGPSVDFGYGRANLAAFPRGAWLRSVRRVLTEAADERLGYLDGRGAVVDHSVPDRPGRVVLRAVGGEDRAIEVLRRVSGFVSCRGHGHAGFQESVLLIRSV